MTGGEVACEEKSRQEKAIQSKNWGILPKPRTPRVCYLNSARRYEQFPSVLYAVLAGIRRAAEGRRDGVDLRKRDREEENSG